MAEKLMVIGLDGTNFRILNAMEEEMPNLHSIIEEGHSSVLKSIIPTNTAAAWTSFQTGKNPNKHNVFDFVEHSGNLSDKKVIDTTDITSKFFYQDRDQTNLIVNLPMSTPPRINNKDVLVPDWTSTSSQKIYPSSYSSYVEGMPSFISHEKRATDVVGNSIKHLEKRREPILNLFRDVNWDFFFQLFSVPDWMHHLCYRDIVNNKKAAKVYKKIDDIIGGYREEAPDSEIAIISDHGFTTYDAVFYVNTWLKDNGYLETTQEKIGQDMRSEVKPLNFISKHKHLRKLAMYFCDRFRGYIPLKPEVMQRIEYELTPSVKMEGTTAFCPSSGVQGIYINDDRFTGKINESDKDEVINTLVKKLNQSGYITAVRSEQVYNSNMKARNTPDIMIKEDSYRTYGSVPNRMIRDKPINYHDREGILVSSDKSFNPDRLTQVAGEIERWFE